MCNRAGCEDPGAHVHLRKSDERAIADVLLAEWEARRYRREQRLRLAELDRRLRESRMAAEENGGPG